MERKTIIRLALFGIICILPLRLTAQNVKPVPTQLKMQCEVKGEGDPIVLIGG